MARPTLTIPTALLTTIQDCQAHETPYRVEDLGGGIIGVIIPVPEAQADIYVTEAEEDGMGVCVGVYSQDDSDDGMCRDFRCINTATVVYNNLLSGEVWDTDC